MKLLSCLILLVLNTSAIRFEYPLVTLGNSDLHLFHISKAGGTSYRRDIKKYFKQATDAEGCHDDFKGRRMITMLREPRAHVLSQYFHCRTSSDHIGHDVMPSSFSKWIDLWSEHITKMEQFEHAFCCFYPNNMVAARLACGNGVSERTAHFHPQPTKVLKKKLGEMVNVGILEAYHESLCLLRIRETGRFPSECDCREAGKHTEGVHYGHGVKPHNVSDYAADVWKKVDKLTSIDRELYEFAKQRFFDDIRAVEQQYQKPILCRDLDFSALPNQDEEDGTNLRSFPDGRDRTFPDSKHCPERWVEEAKQVGFPLP